RALRSFRPLRHMPQAICRAAASGRGAAPAVVKSSRLCAIVDAMSRVAPRSGAVVTALSAPGGHGAGPPAPPREDIERAVRAKTSPRLVERLPPSLLLPLVSLCLFTVSDLLCFRDRLVPLMALKAVQFATAAAVLWMIRTGRVPRNAVAFALCAGTVL